MADYIKTPNGNKYPLSKGFGYTNTMTKTKALATLWVDADADADGNGTNEAPYNDIQKAIDACKDGVNTDIVLKNVFRPASTIKVNASKSVNLIGCNDSSIRGSMLFSKHNRKCGTETKLYVGNVCPQWIFVGGKVRYPASTDRNDLFKCSVSSEKDATADTMTRKIAINSNDANKLKEIKYSEAWVTFLFQWMSYKLRIEDINDVSELVSIQGIGTTGGGVQHATTSSEKYRIILENVNISQCEMYGNKDTWQEGTYYVNDGYLYYKKTADENGYEDIEIPRVEVLLRSEGECNMYNLEVCHSNHVFDDTCYEGEHRGYGGRQACAMFNAAIEINGTSIIDGCKFHHNTNHCVKLYNNAHDCSIVNNKFHDTGCSSVVVGFVPKAFKKEIPTTCPKKINIGRNVITAVGRIYSGACGLAVFYGADYHIVNNVIRNTYYTGISTGYTWNTNENPNKNGVIDGNVIDMIAVGSQALIDGGGTYNLGNAGGLTIKNNIISNVYGLEYWKYGFFGIYFDEGSSNIQCTNNLTYNVHRTSNMKGNSSVSVINNIFMYPMRTCIDNAKPAQTVQKNIFMVEKNNPFTGITMSNWSGNCYFKEDGSSFEVTWNDANPHIGNPFISVENKDFRINDNALIEEIGFTPFDIKIPQIESEAVISDADWEIITANIKKNWQNKLPK